MRFYIESDGTGTGTRVVLIRDGEEINLTDAGLITAVSWRVAPGELAEATLTLDPLSVDVQVTGNG